ncbi:flagellar hook capping FlgD N-terminal domain-containing protein [Massilia sp.]|uniref:flagellar hook capping FlgD N-terminal domain-containing protein n=1 Tax=Massilia sp. TaxID=1882437 RepID=UPI00289FDF43|nr:flagellar hook capping FlgD N-terminal domain-containing protein [Massilia sp.]
MVTATNAIGLNGNTTSTLSDQVTPSSTPVSDNKDMFTKLLVAQIRNQDPLAPSDPSEFVNQLSQLSQTEALQNLTTTTAASAGVLQSLQVLAMGAQVGSDVSVATSRVQLDGAALSGTVQLGGASTLTHLVLTDVAGKQTRIELPPHGAGAQSFTLDPAALGLPAGKYSIAAEASDGTKPGIEIDGRLQSVRLASSGAIVMQVSGVGEVEPGLITGFNGKTTPAALAAMSTEN